MAIGDIPTRKLLQTASPSTGKCAYKWGDYSVATTMGFLKGESEIRIFREYLQVKRNFPGCHFWARGYFFGGIVGLDEQMIQSILRTKHQNKSAKSK